jgi:hypothetical protein
MIWLILLPFTVLAADRAFWPIVCPAPDKVIVCSGDTSHYQVQARDPENTLQVCDETTSPEACYFILLTPTKGDCSIDNKGLITYIAPEQASSEDIEVTVYVYDRNNIQTDNLGILSFDAYNPAAKFVVIFSVIGTDGFPKLKSDQGPEELFYNIAFTQMLELESDGDYKYEVGEANNLGNLGVLSSGRYYGMPKYEGSDLDITLSFKVIDKYTECYSILTLPHYYPNYAPDITDSDGILIGYTNKELKKVFKVYDLNDGSDSLTVTAMCNGCNLSPSIEWNSSKNVYDFSVVLGTESSYEFVITARDNGAFNNQNVKTTTLTFTVEVQDYSSKFPQIITPADTLMIVKSNKDWVYIPEINFIKTYIIFSLSTSPLTPAIKLIDNNKGSLYWSYSDLNQALDGAEILISLTASDSDYPYLPKITNTFTIKIVDPPVLKPPIDLFWFYGKQINLDLEYIFEDPDVLSWTVEPLEFIYEAPVLSRNGNYQRFTWNPPETGLQKHWHPDGTKFVVRVTVNSGDGSVFSNQIEFQVQLRDYVLPVFEIPDAEYMAYVTSDYGLDLLDFTDYFKPYSLKSSISGLSNDISFSYPKFTWSSARISTFTNGSRREVPTITLILTDTYNYSLTLTLNLIAVPEFPSISIPVLYCTILKTCTWDLRDYMDYFSGAVLSNGSLFNTWDSVGAMTLNSNTALSYTPAFSAGTSGRVTLSINIDHEPISAIFEVYVNRPPRIESIPFVYKYLIFGESWQYTVNTHDEDSDTVECDMEWEPVGGTGLRNPPAYNRATKTVRWDSVNLNVDTGTLTGLKFEVTCKEVPDMPQSSTVYEFETVILHRCSIEIPGSVPIFYQNYEISFTVNVRDLDRTPNLSSLLITRNRPPTMSIEKQSSSDTEVTPFLIKWISDQAGTSIPLTFTCLDRDNDSDLPYFSNTLDLTITTRADESTVISRPVFSIIITGAAWSADFTVSSEDVVRCTLEQTGLEGMSVELIEDESGSRCRLYWTGEGSQAWGVRQTNTIKINAIDHLDNISTISFTLYPNDKPVISAPVQDIQLVIKYGRTYLEYQPVSSDSNTITYSMTITPSFTGTATLDPNTGLITLRSPDVAPEDISEPSETFILVLTVTDNHPTSLSTSVTIEIVMYLQNLIPIPVCPNGTSQSVEVDIEWSWDVDNDPNSDNVDEFDSTLVYELINSPSGMRIVDRSTSGGVHGRITWTPSEAKDTDTITVKVTDEEGAPNICTFKLYPNYRPVISPVNQADFTFNEGFDWYYHLDISDRNERLETLDIELLNLSPGLSNLQLTHYGLLHWSINEIYPDPSRFYSFDVKVTDNGTPRFSSTRSFTILVNAVDDPPRFTLPLMTNLDPFKQYIVDGTLNNIQEESLSTLTISYEDDDTPSNLLTIEIEHYPTGMTYQSHPTMANTWIISWTPAESQETSGQVLIRVYQTDNPTNKDEFEYIIHRIKLLEDPPILAPIEDVVITDKDYFVTYFSWSDIDTPFEYVDVSLTGDVHRLGVELRGKGTIVRPYSRLLETITGTITVHVSSFAASTSGSFQLTVTPVNDPPKFVNYKNGVVEGIQTSYTVDLELEASDEEQTEDSLRYCMLSRNVDASFGAVSLNSDNKIVWNLDDDETYWSNLINIRVTDQPDSVACDSLTSYDERTLIICRDFPCRKWPQNDLYTFSFSVTPAPGATMTIHGPGPLTQVLLANHECTDLSSSDTYTTCKLPSKVYGNQIPVYLQNAYGWGNTVYLTYTISKVMPEIVAVDSDSLLGLPGEYLRITSSGELEDYFSCWVEIAAENVKEAGYYYYGISEAYCLLPQLDIGDYKVYLCADDVDRHSCSNKENIHVCGSPVFQDSLVTGKDHGYYDRKVKVDLKTCSKNASNIHFKFGEFITVEATSSSQFSGNIYEVTFNVPPNFYKTSETETLIDLYISANGGSMKWNLNPIEFKYTGTCLVSEDQKGTTGQYCSEGDVIPCPKGYKCDTTYSSVIEPVPCSPGTYQDSTSQISCKICPIGSQCDEEALQAPKTCEAGFICNRKEIDWPRLACPPGFYCPAGTNTFKVRVDIPGHVGEYLEYYEMRRRYDSLLGMTDHWYTRGRGISPYYSGSYTPECIQDAVDAGQESELESLVASGQATYSYPKKCPHGYYCLLGAKRDLDPSIPYSDTNFDGPRHCQDGYICLRGFGEAFDNGNTCPISYYCPGSSVYAKCLNPPETEGDQDGCSKCICPAGYRCPVEALIQPIICSKGTYQSNCGMNECFDCPQGQYCDEEGIDTITKRYKPCPKGMYCPLRSAQPIPCSSGTYQDLEAQEICKQCPVGYYCPSSGMKEVFVCESGTICSSEGTTSTEQCPEKYYCLEGTSSLIADEACPAGKICPIPCPKGNYCPRGSTKPSPCDAGTYQDQLAQVACKDCPIGNYCPEKTMIYPQICPEGYCCETTKLVSPTAQCPAGYRCEAGTQTCLTLLDTASARRLQVEFLECGEDVIGELMNQAGQDGLKVPIPCKPGTFCPSGTAGAGAQTCPKGTYNQFCGKFECRKCPEGFECADSGLTTPTLCPLGTFRNGLVLECQPCPAGFWSGDSEGLRESKDCELCPAGKMCPKEGITSIDEMVDCSSGFYCIEGTINPSDLCPESSFCPPGLKSEEEAKSHLCPPGKYCPSGTSISAEKYAACEHNEETCQTGYDCPTDRYCPRGTGSDPLLCPYGTTSSKNSNKIEECTRIEEPTPKVFGSVNALAGLIPEISLDPLTYYYFRWNLTTIPAIASTPSDYILTININTISDSIKIPFIEIEDYTPTRRIPLMNKYSDLLVPNQIIDFAVLSHFRGTIAFRVEFLNGLFNSDAYNSTFEETVSFISKEVADREYKSAFLAVLSRQSEDYFEQPGNIGISSYLKEDGREYNIYAPKLVYPVSVTLLNNFEITTDASPIDTYNLWDELSLDHKLYPIDYLPYISDCEGWGASVPIYKLTNHEDCVFVEPDDTETVAILQPLRVPKGDQCDLSFTCMFAENTERTGTEKKDLWISASENSLASVFYLTRPQFLDIDYENAIPFSSSANNDFSVNYYGTGDLIQVKAQRLDLNYEAGMVPRDVKLEIGYFQKSQIEKEILKATLYFSNFDSDNDKREYNFSFTFYALPWYECLNLFAFESYMYYIFILLVCVVILGLIFAFWAINYALSKTYPRPSLKIKIYLNYSLNALKGILMGIAPIFVLTVSMAYFINNLTLLKLYPGDHDDKQPLDPNDPQDVDRVTKYQNGRIGWVMFICSWYVIFKASGILFPKPEAVQNEEDRPRLNEEMLRLKGLFLWSLIPVLVFCLGTQQFAQSEVFGNYGTYFIIVFKMMNTRLVDSFKMKFGDDLFVLPHFGAMTLTIMMITVEVGEFTKFLQGYLTQIGIKIFKRAFIEPSRLNIKNKITRLKARLGLKTGLDPVEGLSFKDQVYIEQLEDLGRNSMEYIAAWLFPSIIVFQYFFYDVLKIPTSKDFFQYFIILSLIQAFAEIFYDIFLNNAIECKTGRLLSEKITALTNIFKARKTRWALSDKTVHTGKKLLTRIDTIQRMGFSTQYFFLMSLMTLGVVMQLFGYQIWVKWSYNPMKDPTTIVMIPIFIGLCMVIEYLAKYFGNRFKIWQLDKDDMPKNEPDFYDVMKYYIDREIEQKVRSNKGEILKWAMSKLILDLYRSENEDSRRKAAITRFLKKLEEAIQSYDHYEGAVSNEPLGLPKIRKQTPYLKVKRILEEKPPVTNHGDWPDQLNYPWEAPSFSQNFAFRKSISS